MLLEAAASEAEAIKLETNKATFIGIQWVSEDLAMYADVLLNQNYRNFIQKRLAEISRR